MRVISDTVKNADAILGEMLTLVDRTSILCDAITPIDKAMKKMTTRKSPPVYVAETGRVLKENFIEDFGAEFPTISSGVINGRLGSASYRLHDGAYKLGTCLKKMKDFRFIVMSDADRAEIHNAMLDVVADFAIYTIIAFRLHQSSDETCTLSVSKVCERRRISPSILYGELLNVVKETGRTYFAYEELSPLYGDMLAAEPQLLAECEEQELPLTEEIALDILEGRVTAVAALDMLLKQNADVESKEVDVNPVSLISRMNLE